MVATVTVYFNTGFNGIDIPASQTTLSLASSKSYSDVYFIREDIDKPTIKIKDTYENLCAVDYCAITTQRGTSFYFAVPSALSKGVTLLSLDLDALLTMGGAINLDYISGWQERGHISQADDTLFGNIASEEWIPSQPLETANSQGFNITTSATADVDVIISNISLHELGATALTQEVIEGIVSGASTASMYLPLIRTVDPTNETPFSIWDFDDTAYHTFSLPNTAGYDASNLTVRQGIQKLYSCGQLQLQSSYKIPKEYLASDPAVGTGSSEGRLGTIEGMHGTVSVTGTPYEYTVSGYTIKNKKVFATYRNFALVNLGSGDMNTKKPEEIYDGTTGYPVVRMWADPCSTGKPYARFDYIKGNPIQYADCVRGLQWANSQLVMEGASGSLWNSLDNAYTNQQLEYQKAFNSYQSAMATAQNQIRGAEIESGYQKNRLSGFMSSLSSALSGNFGGTVSGVASQKINEYQNQLAQESLRLNEESQRNAANYQETMIQQQINQNAIGLLKNNQVVAPTISFTPEQNLGLYGYNKFVLYEVRKTDEDLKSEDMYYQRYGYNGLHRPLTPQCFNERQYYCYVQAFDVNLKGVQDFGLRVRTKAISQLNKGVRVWKVLPDASYYDLN